MESALRSFAAPLDQGGRKLSPREAKDLGDMALRMSKARASETPDATAEMAALAKQLADRARSKGD